MKCSVARGFPVASLSYPVMELLEIGYADYLETPLCFLWCCSQWPPVWPRDNRVQTQLEKGFLHPPDSTRPWVYWFWINGNITREGITADLEAMKRVGIGGALIMEVDPGTPKGHLPFMTMSGGRHSLSP